MSNYFNRKNIYLALIFLSIFVIVLWSFTKTNFKWTNDTATYLFFNAFWAVVIVLLDKFFHEHLQVERDTFKTKIDKLNGLLVTDEEFIKTESIRLVLNGKDDEVSAMKAKSIMEDKISKTDSVKKPGRVKLRLE